MDTAFVEVVETVRHLSTEEKLELRSLLDNYLADERRDQIRLNYKKSQRDEAEGRLTFASDLNELEAMLDDCR